MRKLKLYYIYHTDNLEGDTHDVFGFDEVNEEDLFIHIIKEEETFDENYAKWICAVDEDNNVIYNCKDSIFQSSLEHHKREWNKGE